MNETLENVFKTRQFVNQKNETVKIHSETSRDQCLFLQKIIADNRFCKSLEIGFAYGISTLAIIEKIAENGGAHLAIDKYQQVSWGGGGLDLINQAGYADQLKFFPEFSYVVLPKLLESKERFDFAYVDSTKLFDWLMVDFFYIDKLLDINGIVVFDDVVIPGIRKLMRFISQFPNYRIYDCHPKQFRTTNNRKIVNFMRKFPFSDLFLKEDIILSDAELGINTQCLALQKISQDKRNWDWHVRF